MIDKEKFKDNYKLFDKEIILEIIDIFINEHQDRLDSIRKNIEDKDCDALRFSAHSLKGVIANFLADEPKELARQLEEKGKNKIPEGLEELYSELQGKVKELVVDLEEIKQDYL